MYSIQNDYHAVHESGHRDVRLIKWIVLHDMESTNLTGAAEGAGSWFENKASGGSTHYGVDNDSIQRYLSDDTIAWGAPYANTNGLHVEQMGKASWTRDQWMDKAKGTLDRTAWLVAKKCKRYGIPCVYRTASELKDGKRGVTTHAQCTKAFGGSHTDPGDGWPRRWVMDRARHYLAQMD